MLALRRPVGIGSNVERWETFERGQPRAPRFALLLPVQYRRHGENDWESGSMHNISRSGLLFAAPQAPPLDARIELTFALPRVTRDELVGSVRCRGEVVRSAHSGTDHAVAIRILDYEFMRTPRTPPSIGVKAATQ